VFSAAHWQATVDFNALLTGNTLAPVATAFAIGALIAGGLSLLTGRHTRVGALLVLAFLVPATIRHVIAAGHAVQLAEPAVVAAQPVVGELSQLAKRGQMAAVVKNLGLIAVVVFVALRGVGPQAGSDVSEDTPSA